MKGFSWLFFSRLTTIFFGVMSLAIYSRILSIEDVAFVFVVNAFVIFASTLFDGVLNVKILKEEVFERGELLAAAILLSVPVIGVVIILGNFFRIFYKVGDFNFFVIGVLAISCKFAYSVCSSFLQIDFEYKKIAITSIVSYFVGVFCVGVPLAFYGWGVSGAIFGGLVSAFLEAFLSFYLQKEKIKIKLKKNIFERVKIGSPIVFWAQLANWISISGVSIFSGVIFGPVFLGYYSRSWRILEIGVSAVAAPMQKIFAANLSKNKNDGDRLEEIFHDSILKIFPIVSIVSVIVFWNSDLIVKLILGEKWSNAGLMIQVLYFSFVPRCMYKITEGYLMMVCDNYYILKRQLVYTGLMTSCLLFGVVFGDIAFVYISSAAIWVFYGYSVFLCLKKLKKYSKKIMAINLKWILILLALGLFFGALKRAIFLVSNEDNFFALISFFIGAAVLWEFVRSKNE